MPEFIKRKNKRGDVVWTIRIFAGFDENGKKKMINQTVLSASRKGAETVAREIESKRDKGTLITERCVMRDLFTDLVLDYRNNSKDSNWAERVVRKHLRRISDKCRRKK